MKDKVIPHSKLQEGFDSCKLQIKTLLESSDLLYSKRKYSISISLSILAYEEIAKIQYIIDNLDHNNSISKKEWVENKSHKKKLGYIFTMGMEITSGLADSVIEIAEEEREKLGYEKNTPEDYRDTVIENSVKKLLDNLNIVKQDGFYVDWDFRKEKWNSLILKYSLSELKAIAYLLLTKSKSIFYEQLMLDERVRKRLTHNDMLKLTYAKKIKILNKESEKPKNKQLIITAFNVLNREYAFFH